MAVSVHCPDGWKKAWWIEAGTIRRRKAALPLEEVSFEMMFLDEGCLKDVVELQERSTIGVLTKDGLIAYNMISIPAGDMDNFGADIAEL